MIEKLFVCTEGDDRIQQVILVDSGQEIKDIALEAGAMFARQRVGNFVMYDLVAEPAKGMVDENESRWNIEYIYEIELGGRTRRRVSDLDIFIRVVVPGQMFEL